MRLEQLGVFAQVNLVQADNLSWFGYPEDPIPSVRATLLPGITKASSLPTWTSTHAAPVMDIAMWWSHNTMQQPSS